MLKRDLGIALMEDARCLHGQHDEEFLDRRRRRIDDPKPKAFGARNHLSQELVYRIRMHSGAIRNARPQLRSNPAQKTGGAWGIGVVWVV